MPKTKSDAINSLKMSLVFPSLNVDNMKEGEEYYVFYVVKTKCVNINMQLSFAHVCMGTSIKADTSTSVPNIKELGFLLFENI